MAGFIGLLSRFSPRGASSRPQPVVAAALPARPRAPAPAPFAPDTPEPGSVEAIAAATTDPRFLSPWVAYVPASATVPSPARLTSAASPARRAS